MRKYKFYRQETGEWEEVKRERWRWEAVYKDKTVLKQFSDDPISEGNEAYLFHQIREIDLSQLAIFRMVSDEPPYCYSLVYDPSVMKLVHFYKHVCLNFGTPDETHIWLYYFGFQKKIDGKNYDFGGVIGPDNVLILIDDFKIKVT